MRHRDRDPWALVWILVGVVAVCVAFAQCPSCASTTPEAVERTADVLADLLEAELDAAEAAGGMDEDLAEQIKAARVAVGVLRAVDADGDTIRSALATLRGLGPVYCEYLAARGMDPDQIERRVRPMRLALGVLEIAAEVRSDG